MRLFFSILFCLGFISLSAQQFLPTPRNIQSTYERGTRSTDGKPGKNYWQNKADYDLAIQYAPDTRLLSGTAAITYTNNSPDALRQILFKLYPNYYKKGAPRESNVNEEDLSDGVAIDELAVNGKPMDVTKLRIDNTNMWVNIESLASGKNIQFNIKYHYTLNKGSHMRTGEIEPNAAFIAYFFPRIAVCDDIDGWNTYPYNGTQEFYNDFCHFKAAITVPQNFLVWATGDLKNGKDIINPVYYQRLQQAEQNDDIITIIDTTDLPKKDFTGTDASYTWSFEAADVTDFVFAVSDHYVWKSSSLVVDPQTKRRTRVDAAFNPRHKDYFNVVFDARKTVQAMSYTFPAWPFPYSHETVFDGLDQMEYPMMVNDNPVENREESIELTDHEIFHTMFPFYMGINETKYAWMDEGWATIGEWLISAMIDTTIVDRYGVGPYAGIAGKETDLPIITLSTEINRSYFANSYPKPAMGYLYIKDYLGDELFTKALHHYIEQWHGKHPMPNDFFYSMNEGAAKNLNWFWKKWFFDNGIPDLAISSVEKKGNKYAVVITNKGGKPVPVDILVSYQDGSKEKIHRSIAVWEKGAATIKLSIAATKAVAKLTLGDAHTSDSNPKDNTYEIK